MSRARSRAGARWQRLLGSLALATAATLGGCGDDGGELPEPIPQPEPPPMPKPTTFTSTVLDLIQNQTKDTTPPVDFATVSPLADPDDANPAAYSALF